MDNSLRLLGIAKKAGRLEIGEECVGAAARSKKAKVILSASDASDGSKRRAAHFAEAGNIPYIIIPFNKYELGGVVGRGSPGILAITDIGIASSFTARLAAGDPVQYGETAAALKYKATRALQRKNEAKAHERNIRTGKRRTRK